MRQPEIVAELVGEHRRSRPRRQQHIAAALEGRVGSPVAPVHAGEVVAGQVEVADALHDQHGHALGRRVPGQRVPRRPVQRLAARGPKLSTRGRSFTACVEKRRCAAARCSRTQASSRTGLPWQRATRTWSGSSSGAAPLARMGVPSRRHATPASRASAPSLLHPAGVAAAAAAFDPTGPKRSPAALDGIQPACKTEGELLLEVSQSNAVLEAPLAPLSEEALRRKLGIPDAARRVLDLRRDQPLGSQLAAHLGGVLPEPHPAHPRRGARGARAPSRGASSRSRASSSSSSTGSGGRASARLLRAAGRTSGRLRLTGSGITTPDTLLPDTESILRDYLHGQEWLRAPGHRRPSRASPTCRTTSATRRRCRRCCARSASSRPASRRIDGMYFVGRDYRRAESLPPAGLERRARSQRELRTLDFLWRAPDGAEVLCHWNAFTYFQGDMLATRGSSAGWAAWSACPGAQRGHVARRMRGVRRRSSRRSRRRPTSSARSAATSTARSRA